MNIKTRKQAAAYSEKCLQQYYKKQAKEPSEIKIVKREKILASIVVFATISTILIALFF